MLDLTTLDASMSTIAVVVEAPTQPLALDPNSLKKILTPPLSVGQALVGSVTISSQRDQIDVTAEPTKINVRDLSGRQEFEHSRVPSVLHELIGLYKTTISSYGINFLLTVECPSSGEWVRDNILRLDLPEKTGRTLVSANAGFRIEAQPKVWNIKLDTSDRSRLAIDFNGHEVSQELPTEDRLREELGEQFEKLLELLKSLG